MTALVLLLLATSLVALYIGARTAYRLGYGQGWEGRNDRTPTGRVNLDHEGHDMIIWGPAREGEILASGEEVMLPGWIWCCSCGARGMGHVSEAEAEEGADLHLQSVEVS